MLELVAGLPRPEVAGLRWTTREQWHVTLRFLGSVESAEPVVAALSEARFGGSGEAVLGPAVGRFGQRVLQVPVAGLEDVARAVVKRTKRLGKPPENRPFSGHLTLARVRDRRGPRVDLRPLCGGPVSASWLVQDVVLFESRLHPHGARYEELARFQTG